MRRKPTAVLLLALLTAALPIVAAAQVPTKPTTTTLTLLTPSLIITSPTLPGPVYAGVRTTVGVKVANAKDGTTISVKPIPVTSAACTFVVPQATPVVSMTASGTTSVMVPGMFTHPATGIATTCAFSAEVTATKQDGTTTKTVVNSSNVPIAAPTVYVVQNTADWLSKFAFANTTASGDCTGMSNGPNGIFKVGLVTSDAGQAIVDLTLKIRSGPTGTRCRWDSQPMLLPEGVRLTRVQTEVTASGPCSVTPPSIPDYAQSFQSTENPVMFAGGVVAANPLGAGYIATGIGRLTFVLDCGNTLSNDRFVSVVILSMTFTGPPNLTGFP